MVRDWVWTRSEHGRPVVLHLLPKEPVFVSTERPLLSRHGSGSSVGVGWVWALSSALFSFSTELALWGFCLRGSGESACDVTAVLRWDVDPDGVGSVDRVGKT